MAIGEAGGALATGSIACGAAHGEGEGLSLAATRDGRLPGRRRLNAALAASLAVHALLLSLSFGDGLGLPGLELPWQARRGAEAPALRVALAPAPAPPVAPPLADPTVPAATAAPPAPPESPSESPPESPAESPAAAPATVRMLSPEDLLPDLAPAAARERALLATPRPDVPWAVSAASAVPTAAIATLSAASSPAVEPLRRPAAEALRMREPAAADTALPPARPLPTAAVAALAAASTPAVEPLRRAADALRMRDERTAPVDARWQDASPLPTAAVAALSGASSPSVEPLRRASDSLRARAERPAAELAQLERARQDAAQAAQQLEAARLDAERQEAARLAAAREDAARREAARQDAARAEAARQQAARDDAARADAARQDAARQEAARAEAAQRDAARAEAEQREARLRAIGRQLDEEAAKRDAARQSPDWKPARRGRLLGRSDANEELVLYAEAWARKIQLNRTFEMVRDAAQAPHVDPIVTVAVRSDGSVESVSFVRSSGVPALDDAVRRVVQSQEHYPAFPPALLRDYDVVEIRRTWHFDSAIRLY
jgi:TonB family protein